MIVARQFIAWNTVIRATRPEGRYDWLVAVTYDLG